MSGWHAPAEAAAGPGQARRIGRFARRLWRLTGGRLALPMGLQIVGGLTEGMSILMMVPVLTLLSRGENGAVIILPDSGPLALLPGEGIGLDVLLTALVALITLRAVIARLAVLRASDILVEALNRVRLDIAATIARADWGAIARRRQADMTHILTGEVDRFQAAASGVVNLVQTLVMLAVYLLASLLISPAMTAVAAATGITMMLVLQPVRARAHRIGGRLTTYRQRQYGIIEDFLSGMRVAKSLNAEGRSLAHLDDTLQAMRADQFRLIRLGTLGGFGFQVATAIGLAVFVQVAVTATNIPLAQLVVLLFVFMRVAPRIMAVEGLTRDTLQNLPAVEATAALRRAFAAAAEPAPAAAALPRFTRSVEARGLDYRHGGEGGARGGGLDGVDLTLPFGTLTAVIGPSGAGKSTLADILAGLVSPEAGTLTVDGHEITRTNRAGWREQVALVPQEVFLIHDTIAANLRLARPSAYEEELWAALVAVRAEGFTRALPDGLQTVVGDRGGRLSGGERQRIALARALLRRPALFVLDEVTSALDWETESAIAESIGALRRDAAVVAITHQPALLDAADRVLALEAGRVVAAGLRGALAREPGSPVARLLAARAARAAG